MLATVQLIKMISLFKDTCFTLLKMIFRSDVTHVSNIICDIIMLDYKYVQQHSIKASLFYHTQAVSQNLMPNRIFIFILIAG